MHLCIYETYAGMHVSFLLHNYVCIYVWACVSVCVYVDRLVCTYVFNKVCVCI